MEWLIGIRKTPNLKLFAYLRNITNFEISPKFCPKFEWYVTFCYLGNGSLYFYKVNYYVVGSLYLKFDTDITNISEVRGSLMGIVYFDTPCILGMFRNDAFSNPI